ncbi:U1 small nuclear ribonucleoprotein 70 kDa-like [Brachypodium distachyon]|uniref:Uncharacterized protein n=1 Tax=Brachypodium distachyon TaxID=15368 RepID=A0A2K2D888_BRADI|nr:U1 small nuclear ribonucleoprotein 70 kDa-like [Brachypodium distachyon]PNT70489.1 hypothetical protein BRADI_2g12891v3 [Brachypodium distachyon]PNT70490.1 hypothetical protein BRADI_2g12891v3 [Brachypodium distachyon]|eukprot:XP_024315296.1 U1 small nuclear ribonucleoprotein 70 kDa-like [Brachypodium distachyon]
MERQRPRVCGDRRSPTRNLRPPPRSGGLGGRGRGGSDDWRNNAALVAQEERLREEDRARAARSLEERRLADLKRTKEKRLQLERIKEADPHRAEEIRRLEERQREDLHLEEELRAQGLAAAGERVPISGADHDRWSHRREMQRERGVISATPSSPSAPIVGAAVASTSSATAAVSRSRLCGV